MSHFVHFCIQQKSIRLIKICLTFHVSYQDHKFTYHEINLLIYQIIWNIFFFYFFFRKKKKNLRMASRKFWKRKLLYREVIPKMLEVMIHMPINMSKKLLKMSLWLFKLEPEASEVDTILSGKVLDTHIPGLDEYTMSHESKNPSFAEKQFQLGPIYLVN